MSAPAAISGTFTKIEAIAGRKVVRLHVECAIEEANQVLLALGGYPDAANPVHVAIARLKGGDANPEHNADHAAEPHKAQPAVSNKPAAGPNGEKWKPDPPQPDSVSCALRCKEESFWQFLREHQRVVCDNEEDAATYVRQFCDVNTRADFATNKKALQRWQFLASVYEGWLPR